MSRRSRLVAVAAICAIGLCRSASPLYANWPQWRGPSRNAVSTETGLLKSWPEGGPKREWLFTNCGAGYGGPAIVDDVLYITGTRDGAEALLAVDALSGEEKWATPIGELYENDWGDGPRGTPAVDGGMVYAISGKGNLACINAASGAVTWTKALVEELGGGIPNWGYCESPLIHENLVICTPGGKQGAIAAFDKATGEVVWRSTGATAGASYSSVVVMGHEDHQDGVQLLQAGRGSEVVGVDLNTGAVKWTRPWKGSVAVIPTPVVHNQLVYITSGYGAGCMLLEVDAEHNVAKAYENNTMKNHHGGVILLDDHVYGHSDGVGWLCQELRTGETAWREREALGKGSIGYADGMFYCLGEDDGEVVLIEASTEGWKEHGRFTLDPKSEIRSDRGKIWTHPVICNGRLFLRDQDLVYCYDVRQ